MKTIEDLCADIDAGNLRIDCTGIHEADAERIAEILRSYLETRINDSHYNVGFGATNYGDYIIYFVGHYPLFGVNHGDVCMWSNYRSGIPVMGYQCFLDIGSQVTEDPNLDCFDDLLDSVTVSEASTDGS